MTTVIALTASALPSAEPYEVVEDKDTGCMVLECNDGTQFPCGSLDDDKNFVQVDCVDVKRAVYADLCEKHGGVLGLVEGFDDVSDADGGDPNSIDVTVSSSIGDSVGGDVVAGEEVVVDVQDVYTFGGDVGNDEEVVTVQISAGTSIRGAPVRTSPRHRWTGW